MDRAGFDQFYKDNVNLIHMATRRVSGRLIKIGMPMTYDDVFQEVTVAFIKAYDGFDESRGKFSTYFMWATYNQINKLATNHENSADFHCHSAQDMVEGDGEDAGDWAELMPDDAAGPEQTASARQLMSEMLETLSPLAKTLVTLAIDPPAYIERELVAAQAHAERSRSIGVPKRSAPDVTLTFVCQVVERVGVDRNLIAAARREAVSVFEELFK